MATEQASAGRRPLETASDPTVGGSTSVSNGDAKTIVIRDRRKPAQYTTDNLVAREWLPILRVGDAFYFYSIYLSMANRETESSWGSLRTQAEYLQCSVDLIIRGNKLLEICELLYIETGNRRVCNEYYILDPPPLTDELKERIHKHLDEIAEGETSRNWQAWVKQVRKALGKHRSLPSIWAEKRTKKGGRPVKTVRPESDTGKGVRESQTGLSANGDRDSRASCAWDTSTLLVTHKQGARESQPKQEQLTRKTNKTGKRVQEIQLFVRDRCAHLGVAPTVVDVLLENYPVDEILDQLEWLPCREPRDPAAMLVSALQRSWTRPAKYDHLRAERIWSSWMAAEEQIRSTSMEVPAHEPGKESATVEERDISLVTDPPPVSLAVHGTERDARKVWSCVLEELRLQMTRATFDTWLGGSQVIGVADGMVTVLVRDGYAADWLRARWEGPIQRTLAGIVGQPVDVRFQPKDPGPGP